MDRYNSAEARCEDPTHKSYKWYGAKGIRVTMTKKEWVEWFLLEYPLFKELHPDKAPSLGRLDHKYHYCLRNIELVTVEENSREVTIRLGPPRRKNVKA